MKQNPLGPVTPNLRCLFANVRSILSVSQNKPKLQSLQIILLEKSFDIIALVETFATKTISDEQIVLDSGYKIFRCDKIAPENKCVVGGGVMLFIHPRLQCSFVSSCPKSEYLCVDIFPYKTSFSPLRFVVWYRAPRKSETDLSTFLRTLSSLNNGKCEIVLMCDANLPSISWTDKIASCPLGRLFLENCASLGLSQFVFEPTRRKNILDLVLSTKASLVSSVKVCEPICFSDHCSISFSVSWSSYRTPQFLQQPFRNLKYANFQKMIAFLEKTDWIFLLSFSQDPTEFYSYILLFNKEATESFVPLCTPKQPNTKSLPPYLIAMRKKRHALYSSRKVCQNSMLRFTKFDKKYAFRVRSYFEKQEKSILCGTSRSALYSFVNKKRGNKTNVIPNLSLEGKLINCDSEKSEIFAEYFASVFCKDNGSLPNCTPAPQCSIENIDVSESEVASAIASLKPKKSTGCDGTSNFLLKNLASALKLPFSLLFEFSLLTCSFPDQLRTSLIVPVYKKKGEKNCVKNYRPISILSATSKLLEKIICNQLVNYFEKNKLLSDCQFGFRQKRSTTGQMLQCTKIWTEILCKKQSADVIYLDFAKAFDVVSHSKLIVKLASFGIAGNLLNWFADYLSGRSLQVKIGNSCSKSHNMPSSICQGACLSGVLFAVYINDLLVELSQLPNIHVWAYADDLKICCQNPTTIQSALSIVENWCKNWQMSLSVEKCVVFPIGAGLKTDYSLCGMTIPHCPIDSIQKDLGFYLSPDMSFSNHVQKICNKSRSTIFLLFRCFSIRNYIPILEAYKVFVRPLLEYGTVVYNVISKKDSLAIERVQKLFTRLLLKKCFLRKRSYPDRLSFLNLEPLFHRRHTFDMTFAYKVYHGLHFCPNIITPKPPSERILSHNHRLLSNRNARGKMKMLLSERIVPTWNQLPDSVIECSLKKFTSAIT